MNAPGLDESVYDHLAANRASVHPLNRRYASLERSSTVRARALRFALMRALGAPFKAVAGALLVDGIVVLEGLVDEPRLHRLRELFEAGAALRTPDPVLGQISFNGAVDREQPLDLAPLAEFAVDVPVQTLAAIGLGAVPVISNWRGYRLEPSEPLLYRAWDWHVDQKRAEVKVMILLTDVDVDGQPMEYVVGSHRRDWRLRTQRETKFGMDEALATGTRPAVVRGYGLAGTVLIFESTGVHRGVRSLLERRDVITVSFVPDTHDAPVFPGMLVAAARATQNAADDASSAIVPATRVERPRGAAFVAALLRHRRDVGKRFASVHISSRELTDDQVATEVADYAATARYEDVKPRLQDRESLSAFLSAHPEVDLNADLDLPLWPGRRDVDRDIQVVALRDAAQDDRTRAALRRRLETAGSLGPRPVDLTAIRDAIASVADAVEAATSALNGDTSNGAKELMRDLVEASSRVDSTQRVRTTLAFAVANAVDCHMNLRDRRAAGHELLALLDRAISAAVSVYASVVVADDLSRLSK